jgi:tetratricopeptide (TPR) repeat protein
MPSPTLLVIDDAHRMDEASSDALTTLAHSIADQESWLVITTRRDVATGFASPPQTNPVVMRPAPLSEAAANALIAAATSATPLKSHQVQALVKRAGGNPLFLVELLAAPQPASSADTLPGSVAALMTAQIDQIGPRDRSLLRRAAVLGETFSDELLRRLFDDASPAPDRRVWRRLAGFVQLAGPGQHRFRHALIRDAAYEGLPYRVRRDLHLRVGAAIEAGESGEDNAALLSLHFFQAGEYQRAWRYATQAADRARRVYANVEAATLYQRALACVRHVADAGGQVAAIHEALGDVHALLGEYQQADEAFRAARTACNDPLVAARLLEKQARIPERLGRYSQALARITRGLRMLDRVDDPARVTWQRAALEAQRAASLQQQGRHTLAVRWCQSAIADAEASQNRRALARAYFLLDWAYCDLGRFEDATYSPHALAIYEELEDYGHQSVVLNNMGVFAYWQGRWSDAVEFYTRGRVTRERTGDAVNAAMGTANVAEILSDQGRLDQAEPMFHEALRVWQAAGDRGGVAFATSALGRIASRTERFDEALELLARAREVFVDLGARSDVVETDARVAECVVVSGDARRALQLADDALARAAAQSASHSQAPLLERVRGWALLGLGDTTAADQAFNASLDAARRRDAVFEEAVTLDALARLASDDRLDDAAALRAAADRILTRLGVTYLAWPRLPPTHRV